jgi:hypothetical protein
LARVIKKASFKLASRLEYHLSFVPLIGTQGNLLTILGFSKNHRAVVDAANNDIEQAALDSKRIERLRLSN